jgi:hypothetical protein
MKVIYAETISRVLGEWNEIHSLDAVMQQQSLTQPHLLNFPMMELEGYRIETRMRGSFLSWFAQRCFELESPVPLPKIGVDELFEKRDANRQLRESLNAIGTKPSLPEFLELLSWEMSAQPVLLRTVREMIAQFFQEDRREGREIVMALTESISMFFVAKTIVDVLDSATN